MIAMLGDSTEVIVDGVIETVPNITGLGIAFAVDAATFFVSANGGRVNMGAHGRTRYASRSDVTCSYFEVDFNADGVVDTEDLAELMEQWLEAAGWKE